MHVLEKAGEPAVKEWNFNPEEILSSPRKVKGIFHQPVIDKDGELINSKGMREAVPDFMHLPALHDFHKERPVGLATKVQELGGGRFYMEGVIKATHDCDDVWEKVKTGNYGQMSIFGKRTKYNNQCALPQSMRSGPCITDGVRLDSISICDENARNPQTSLEVAKAKVVFDADELRKGKFDRTPQQHEGYTRSPHHQLVADTWAHNHFGENGTSGSQLARDSTRVHNMRKYEKSPVGVERESAKTRVAAEGLGKIQFERETKKAETAGDSVLMHSSTDYAGGRVRVKKCPRCKGENPVTTISKEDEMEKSAERVPPKEGRQSSKERFARHEGQVRTRQIQNLPGYKKADDEQDPASPEEHPTTGYRAGKSGGKKDTFNPMRETGSAHPKRTKAGYPIPSGPNVTPKRSNPVGHKGAAPPVENFEERNKKVEEGKQKEARRGALIMENATKKSPEDAPKRKGYRVGSPIKFVRHSVQKADDMDDEMEKAGKRPTITEERLPKGSKLSTQHTRGDVKKEAVPYKNRGEDYHGGRLEKSAAEDLEDEDYNEEDDKDFKHLKPSDKDGNWNKTKNPNGTPGLKKADDDEDEEEDEDTFFRNMFPKEDRSGYPGKAYRKDMVGKAKKAEHIDADQYNGEDDPNAPWNNMEDYDEEDARRAHGIKPKRVKKAKADDGPDEEDEENEEDQEEKYEEEEKEVEKSAYVGKTSHEGKGRETKKKRIAGKDAKRLGYDTMKEEEGAEAMGRMQKAKGDEDASSELFDPSTVTKGEHMVDETETEQDVEYVTKALVPIEEIDTIVKARTEEISKAYMGQLDELKKAYDEKIDNLSALVEKMSNETIRKGGSIVVIPELLDANGTGVKSNADAIAQMQAGRR